MRTHELIKALGGQTAVAAVVNATPNAVNAWCVRDRVPARYWAKVAALARRKGVSGITVSSLSARSAV